MSFSRVGIVTGANKGIGLATLRQIALQYPKSHIQDGQILVYLTARDESRGRDALNKLQSDGQLKRTKALVSDGGLTEFKFHQLDVTNTGSIDALAAYVKKEHPNGIDFLINNAGVALHSFEKSQVKLTLDANYYGTLNTTLALVDSIKPGGRIVNLSSMAASLSRYSSDLKRRFVNAASIEDVSTLMDEFLEAIGDGTYRKKGWPTSAWPPGPYTVSKSGVNALTRVLAKKFDQEGRDILVNCCTPGYVATDITDNQGFKSPDQGAQTPVLLAIHDIGQKTGTYWEDERESGWS